MSPSGTELCAVRPLTRPDTAHLIIVLSTSDHFMIMLGALLIIFTASLQPGYTPRAMLAKRV